jgi:hypothetical protein
MNMRDRKKLKPAQLKKLIQIAGDRRRRRDTRLWAMTQLAEGGYTNIPWVNSRILQEPEMVSPK